MPATRHSRARASEPYKSRQPSDPCPICSKVLSRASDMVRHMKIHDPNAELYHCYGEGCQFYTKHKTNLYDHYRACGLRPPLECEYCPALFTQSASRQRHCEDKHGYKPTTRRKTPQDAVKKEVKPRPKPTFRIIQHQQNAGSWEDVSPNYSTFQLSAADCSSSMSPSEYSELSDSDPETTTSIATPVFSMLSQISLPSDVIYGKECFQASSTPAEWEANASQLDSFDSCMTDPQRFVYTSKDIAPEFTTPYMSQITPGYNAAFGINAQEDFQIPYHLSISNVAGDGFYSSNTDPHLLPSETFSYMPVSGSSFNGDSNPILNEFPELVTTFPQSTSNYLSVNTYQYQPTTTSSLGMQDSSSNLASLDYFEGIWSDECLYSTCIPAV